ncbi:MAG: transglutaminase family protein [Desulfobacterales bacterium]|jgi:transglutaminase-like putative cysteine protease|nr:transglutaminase family protein [Desulfobacterales bacterium]
MNYRITHRTHYLYHEPVSLCHNEARLLPRELAGRQQCHRCQLLIDPAPTDHSERYDFFGNRVVFFTIEQPHEALTVTAASSVSVMGPPPVPQAARTLHWEAVRDALRSGMDAETLEARQFVLDSPLAAASAAVRDYALESFAPGRPALDAAESLMQRIYGDFEFVSAATTLATPLSDLLRMRKGVCQDFAHLAIACLRSLGLAARYMSGYIETVPPPGRERLRGADASHAWFATWLPGAGWCDFDPTNGQMPGERHIVLAWGRDYGDIAPLKGVLVSSGKHEMTVGVDVEPEP